MRRGIQSIEIGLSVLRALARSTGPLHLREIALAAGMPPSKAYRYLVSFTEAGMVKQDADSSQYDLGPFAMQLGLAALGRIDELDIAASELRRVCIETRCDAHLTVWGDTGPTVIRWHQGRNDIAIRVREGALLPIMTSATGRIWACYLTDQIIAPLIKMELAELKQETGTSRSKFLEHYHNQIGATRQHHLSRALGEKRQGIDALSGPVFNRGGIAFAITLLCPQGDFDFSYDGIPASIFREILTDLSKQLGADQAPWEGTTASAG